MRYLVTDQQYLGAVRGDVIDADPTAPRTVAALKAKRIIAAPDEPATAPEPAPVVEPVAEPEPVAVEPEPEPEPTPAPVVKHTNSAPKRGRR